MKRRIEITVETKRVTLAGGRRISLSAQCKPCGARVLLLTPEDASAVSGVAARQLYRWLEAGLIHFVEEPGEPLLVCTASLARAAAAGEKRAAPGALDD